MKGMAAETEKWNKKKKLVCRGKSREWNTAIAQERREKLPFLACLLCPLPPNGFLRKGKKLTWRIHSIPRSRPAEEASQTRSQRTTKKETPSLSERDIIPTHVLDRLCALSGPIPKGEPPKENTPQTQQRRKMSWKIFLFFLRVASVLYIHAGSSETRETKC